VIDAFGGAAMFETRPNSYTLYDANDPTVAPKGYIVRSNFALTAQNLPANPAADEVAELYAGERYLRACSLIDGCPENSLSLEYVLRHMARDMAEPDGQPYCGTINGEEGTLPTVIATDRTISRTTTVSAAVFHGVRPGESPARTTMWAMLGDPKFTIALPCWVQVESIADPLTEETGGEIGEIAITLRDWNLTLERTGVLTRGLPGIWEDVWQVEDEILEETRHALDSWAARNVSISEMTEFHHAMAKKGMAAMERELAQAKQQALQPQDVQSQSPPDSSPLIQVAIYDHAEEISKGPKNLLRILTAENGFQCQRLTPSDIRGGELDKFDVLIMPGGSGSQQAEMLEESGKERVKKFVEQGGGYVGICAGSYLASSQYTWSLALVNAKVWDRAHWARGTGTVTIGFSEEGNELFDGHSNVVDVYYGQGPLLVPGEHPELPGYEVLATYRTEIAAKGAPAGAMTDTHAIVRSDFGQGRVICFSPHPETSEGPNDLITSGVLWSAGQEP
jgi:hypothetical protein